MVRAKGRAIGGFTLVELLVVITIIGVLIGLLLPAVQAAREAARRAQCSSNEHNLGIAMVNFETGHKSFPGYVNNFQVSAGSTTINVPASWMVSILPFIERRDVFDSLSMALATVTTGANGGMTANIAMPAGTLVYSRVLTCPDDDPQLNSIPIPTSNGVPDYNNSWTSYVCNRGLNFNPLIGEQRCAGVCPCAYSGNTSSGPSIPAIAKVSLDYITSHDGSTNTLLLSESVMSNPNTPPRLLYDRSSANSAAGSASVPSTDRPLWLNTYGVSSEPLHMEVEMGFEWGTFAGSATTGTAPRMTDKILSSHPGGGVNVIFCDGHQQFLQSSMDLNTFIHLMTPYDHDCRDNNNTTTQGPWTNVPGNSNTGYDHTTVLDEQKIN
jgi:prepilin-type N-terminal cleavage/methylation domain-containing protein/prepilin-type processing-associated H-X9-DG protein